MICQKGKTTLCTSSIAKSYIQQTVILTCKFRIRIKSKPLNTVNLCAHIYSHKFSARAFKGGGTWILSFPFGKHPLHFDLYGIRVVKISRKSTGWLSVRSIQKPIISERRMKSIAAQTRSQTWL